MTTDLPASAAPASPVATARGRRVTWRGVVVESLVVLAGFALVGAGAGWIWERWATPPEGVVVEGTWRLGYTVQGAFFVSDYQWLDRGFGVIGTFVVVTLVGGLLTGLAAALLGRRAELATLLAVAGGSAVAAYLCYRVGLGLGPPDPAVAATAADDGTILAGDLALGEPSPFVAWAVGALLSLTFTYLLTTGRADADDAG